MNRVRLFLIPAFSLAAALALMTGCEVDSASGTERSLGVNFTGFYKNGDNPIVSRNTGAPIRTLDLRQAGDSLEAIDNNGIIFRGTIGGGAETTSDGLFASFTLKGTTTAGQEGTFSGTLSTSGGSNTTGSSQGSMQGTWVEPSLFSTFAASATIPGQIDTGGGGGNGDTLSVSPSSITVAVNGSATFTASDASGSVTWTLSGGTGSINPTTGTSTTYTRTSSGSETLTARDSDGNTASATIN